LEALWLMTGVLGDLVLSGFNPWTEFIIRPTLNTLMLLYVMLGNQMGVAIIILTILIRLVTLPLTLKQLRQMRNMSALQPKVKEVQERYAKDRARISQETMRVYREAGVSPIGCLGPMVVQMPILFGLFRVLVQTLFTGPDKLVGLAEKIYPIAPFSIAYAAAPMNPSFLWLNLAEPDPTNIVIPALVFISTWVQQKMTIMPSMDPKQQSNQVMMLWMMPLMIGFFSLQFPSGLSLYWIVSNTIGIAIQYFITGWGPLFPLFPKLGAPAAPVQQEQNAPPKETQEDGRTNDDRPNRRRGHRVGAERARRRPRRGRGRNTK
jgi:YidC/Oxa1 family membrane protein insertase